MDNLYNMTLEYTTDLHFHMAAVGPQLVKNWQNINDTWRFVFVQEAGLLRTFHVKFMLAKNDF